MGNETLKGKPMGFRASDPDGFKIIVCNRS